MAKVYKAVEVKVTVGERIWSVLYITVMLALVVKGCLLLTGCASTVQAEPVKVEPPEHVTNYGFRPDEPVPAERYMILQRYDRTCQYFVDGPAGCLYIGRVDFGRSWMCNMIIGQDAAKGEWEPKKMECTPWKYEYQDIIDGIGNSRPHGD